MAKKDVFEEAEDLAKREASEADHEDDDHDEDDEGDEGDDDDPPARQKADEGDDDERLAKGGADDDEVDEEREAIRAQRREKRKQRREAQREREQNLRSELAARDKLIENLVNRVNAIETKGTGNEVQQIDAAINGLASTYVGLKQQLEKGAETNNGKAVADATEKMLQIRQRAEQLAAQKQSIINRQQERAQRPPEVDPRVLTHGETWVKTNSWYSPTGTDQDSIVTRALDDALVNEGYDPKTPEYWKELTVRVKKVLPHRFKTSYTESDKGRTPQKTIVAGSSRSGSDSSGKAYQLSPERVTAMKELGIWEDPKRRAAMIAEYKKFDKENEAAR